MSSFADKDTDRMVFIENQGIIKSVSLSFCEFSRFSFEELIENPLKMVWKDLLRINIDFNIPEGGAEAFLFTRSLDVRCVNIQMIICRSSNEITYLFNEIPNSRFEERNSYTEQLLKAEFAGISVYSVPDMILIKANKKYFSFLEPPFNLEVNSPGRKIEELITGWKGSLAEQFWIEAINTGKPIQVKEYENIDLEKGNTYWDSVITPIYEGERVRYIVSSVSEVTEEVMLRKKYQEQSNLANFKSRQLEAVIEGLSDMITIIDKNGSYLKMSNFAREAFKECSNIFDVLSNGAKFYDFDGNKLSQPEMCAFRVLNGEVVQNHKYKLIKDGKERYANCSGIPVLNIDGGFETGIIFAYDISDLMLKERELEQQRQQIQTIIDSMSDAVTIFDKNGEYIVINRSASDLFSLPQKLKIGDFFKQDIKLYDDKGDILSEEARPESRILRGEQFKEYDLCLEFSDGRKIYFNVSGTPVYASNGDFLMGIMVSRDTTERKIHERIIATQKEAMLNAEIKEKEVLENAMKLKDEFLYLITHEFKTPLAVINSALQAMDLLCKQQMPAKADRFINIIKQNTNRQLRLVNNLLDIVRINAGHIKLNRNNFDIVFLTQVIVDSVQIYAQQKKIKLDFSTRLHKKEIYIDEEKFERILLNLLSNALKFTSGGKSINVHLFPARYKSRSMVCISVADEGIGIPEDKQDYIFSALDRLIQVCPGKQRGQV